MKMLVTVIAIGGGLFIVDRICLWLEGKGWLYYRNNKAQGGIIGNMLLELQNVLNPSTRPTIELKQNGIESMGRETDNSIEKEE